MRCGAWFGGWLVLMLGCAGAPTEHDPADDDTTDDDDAADDDDSAPVGPFTWTNPVYPGDFPDPFVLVTPDGLYAFGTNTTEANIQVLGSEFGAIWTHLGDALPTLPDWAQADALLTWAPGALATPQGYTLLFTARDVASGRQCIGVATSSTPEGPYEPTGDGPLVCQVDLGGSIDPYPFVDTDGSRYLLWKNDGNCCGYTVALYSQPLSEDGLSLSGQAVQLVQHDLLWEVPLIENPALLVHEGLYHLTYSANWWESADYATGHAICESPSGPCEKTAGGAIHGSSEAALGPGGGAFYVDEDERTFFVYHAWTAPSTSYAAGGARSMRIDTVRVDGDVLILDGPTTSEQTVP